MLIAQERKHARVKNIRRTEDALVLNTENGNIKLEPYSDEIIRIVYTLADEFSTIRGLGTIRHKQKCEWSYTEKDNNIIFRTNKVKIIINKESSAFSYYDYKDNLLTKEPSNGGKFLQEFKSYSSMSNDIKEDTHDHKKELNKTLYRTRLEFEWTDNEAIYGLGQHEEGSLNLRGTRKYIHQANMKIAMPFFVSTNNYGVLIDTYSPIIFNDNEYGSYIHNEAANELDYYFIYGKCLDDIISGYRYISGKAPMLPKWAFGYMQSFERYETQEEIINTVMEYRRRQIPLDTIVLDWQSWENGKWGQKTFDLTRFPDAKQMTDILHKNGAHFMISVWPTMNECTDNYKEKLYGISGLL